MNDSIPVPCVELRRCSRCNRLARAGQRYCSLHHALAQQAYRAKQRAKIEWVKGIVQRVEQLLAEGPSTPCAFPKNESQIG